MPGSRGLGYYASAKLISNANIDPSGGRVR